MGVPPTAAGAGRPGSARVGSGRVGAERADALERAFGVLGRRCRRDWPIGPMTTYRVGGAAALFLEVEGEEDLALAAEAVGDSGLPVLVLGKGSNLLVCDRGFPGLALALGPAYSRIEVSAELVRAGGAVGLPVVARRTAAAGLTGMEWAVGVPGSVGGGVRMNAGGHGSDIRTRLQAARVVDLAQGTDQDLDVDALGLGYRQSALGPTEVVVRADFLLSAGERQAAEAEIAAIVRWRRQHQPGGSNAGSVFVNPEGDTAGRLVEAAGLKGHRLGTAQVSPKHANFIQADSHGMADDVAALVRLVQAGVAEAAGVWLRPELEMVGFPSLSTSSAD